MKELIFEAAHCIGIPDAFASQAVDMAEWLEEREMPGMLSLAQYFSEVQLNGKYDQANCPIVYGFRLLVSPMFHEHSYMKVYQPLLLLPALDKVLSETNFRIYEQGGVEIYKYQKDRYYFNGATMCPGLVQCRVENNFEILTEHVRMTVPATPRRIASEILQSIILYGKGYDEVGVKELRIA